MNELMKAEQTISSLDVAEMVEKEHGKLLRDIRRYTKQLGEAKIGSSEFWTESTYVNSQNKGQPCYNITKKGCEFIAHKITGTKGTIFTARYINKFHEMEGIIKKQLIECEQNVRPDWYELEKQTSKVPLIKSWYERNKFRMNRICKTKNANLNILYHFILKRVGEKYDLNAANQIYEAETGKQPKYAMDIIEYFPELGEEADKYLDKLENLK